MTTMIATVPAPGHENEDFVGANSGAVVLLDGSGSAGNDNGCIHGVAWYSNRLGSALLATLLGNDESPLPKVLAACIDQVNDLHRDRCDLSHPASPSSTVVIARHNEEFLDYLVLADSTLVVATTSSTPLIVTDDREASAGRRHRTPMDAIEGGTPAHDEALRRYVAELAIYRNRPEGFWVASTDPAAAEHAIVGTVAMTNVTAVLTLSDGASRLVDRFGLASWPQAIAVVMADGPDELLRRVRAAEYSDPHGQRWPRGKIHDDATVLCRTFDR